MELPRHPGGPVAPGREEEKHHAGDATAPWRNGWAPIQQIPAGLNGFDTTQYRVHLETAFHLISVAAAVNCGGYLYLEAKYGTLSKSTRSLIIF